MLYIFLDESGDLGFDFSKQSSTKHFTIATLLVWGQENYRALSKIVRRTIHHKSKHVELKGSSTSLSIKKYFLRRIDHLPYQIYALTLIKRAVATHHSDQVKGLLYNDMVQRLIERLPLEKERERIQFVLDRSKDNKEIEELNGIIAGEITSRLAPNVPLEIDHLRSHEAPGLQAIDLFAWGIFKKYEGVDVEWFNYFKESIQLDETV